MKPIILFVLIAAAVFMVAHFREEPVDGNLRNMLDSPSYYHTLTLVVLEAEQIPTPFFVRNSGCVENGEAGDYLVKNQDGFRWIINKEDFEKMFRPLTEPSPPTPPAAAFSPSGNRR